MTVREERAVLERASEQIFSPRSPRAVDLAGLFSLLSVVRRFHPSRPDSFPLSFFFLQTRFRLEQSVSGNTHAFSSLDPTHCVVAWSVHVRACAEGMYNAFRCIEQLSAPSRGKYPFQFNYFINRIFASK